MKLSGNILGLAISDRSIHCAQVSAGARRRIVQKLVIFPIPADLSLDQPEALGQQFRAFLQQHGFKTTRAVIGVPAKWLVAQDREVPPLDEQSAYATLRLQAERISEADHGELVFDVAGRPDQSRSTHVLLVGVMRRQLDRITRFCTTAGLTPLSVTSTSMALARLCGPGDDRPLVVLSRQGAELVWRPQERPQMLRHLFHPATGACAVDLLGGELRRAMALAPPPTGDNAGLLLWDDLGLSANDLRKLSNHIGLPVQRDQSLQTAPAEVSPAALNGSAENATVETFLPAVALAMGDGSGSAAGVDFLHPRLAPPPVPRISRRTLWIGGIATALVLGIGGLYLTVQSRESTAWQLEQQLEQQRPQLVAAEARLDRFNYGRGFFESRPPVLDCLRQITAAINRDDPLWITSFNLRENGRGQIQGRATEQPVVLAVQGRLQANSHFENVQVQDIREAGGTSREITFSISFTYNGGRP